MKLTFLGTGTSYGVPYVGCECEVCTSPDPHNKRLRCSVLVEAGETVILVDTTPDLRQQLLRARVRHVSAVLWTHTHNDHIIGLDDIRPLCDQSGYIDGYGSGDTMARLTQMFDYVFLQGREHGGFPRMTPHIIKPHESFPVGAMTVTAIPIQHYQREILAYRFEHQQSVLIYATDCSGIPDNSWAPMEGADVLVLGALRHRPHVAHFTVEEAVTASRRLKPGRTFLTHLAHDLDHQQTSEQLPTGVELAYDGLAICL